MFTLKHVTTPIAEYVCCGDLTQPKPSHGLTQPVAMSASKCVARNKSVLGLPQRESSRCSLQSSQWGERRVIDRRQLVHRQHLNETTPRSRMSSRPRCAVERSSAWHAGRRLSGAILEVRRHRAPSRTCCIPARRPSTRNDRLCCWKIQTLLHFVISRSDHITFLSHVSWTTVTCLRFRLSAWLCVNGKFSHWRVLFNVQGTLMAMGVLLLLGDGSGILCLPNCDSVILSNNSNDI